MPKLVLGIESLPVDSVLLLFLSWSYFVLVFAFLSFLLFGFYSRWLARIILFLVFFGFYHFVNFCFDDQLSCLAKVPLPEALNHVFDVFIGHVAQVV